MTVPSEGPAHGDGGTLAALARGADAAGPRPKRVSPILAVTALAGVALVLARSFRAPPDAPANAPAAGAASPAGSGDARASAPPSAEASAAFDRALALYERHDEPGARAELERAVALAPGWAQAHRQLGKLLVTMSAVTFAMQTVDHAVLDQAVRELQRAHELEPSDVDGTYWYGRARARAPRPEAAAVRLRARALAPAHGLAWKELGLLYAAHGDVERARQRLARAAELRPTDDEIVLQLALQIEAEGDDAGAIAANERALALNPALLGPRSKLIALFQRQGRVADADRELAALEQWRAFGKTLQQALDAAQRAPDDTAAMVAVAALYRTAGMTEPERRWLELARAGGASDPEIERRLAELGAAPAAGETPR